MENKKRKLNDILEKDIEEFEFTIIPAEKIKEITLKSQVVEIKIHLRNIMLDIISKAKKGNYCTYFEYDKEKLENEILVGIQDHLKENGYIVIEWNYEGYFLKISWNE
jgi:Na+-transporting NADH:ubiquinone oxidoreductase subunit NqrA